MKRVSSFEFRVSSLRDWRVALVVAMVMAWQGPAWAGLTLTTDNRSLFFGAMQLGESKELAQFGSYHNQLTCASTNGLTWYLKVQVLQPLSAGVEAIPAEQMEWQAETPEGIGTLQNPNHYTPFSVMPQLVYISGPNEAGGGTIHLRLKYRLTIPEEQVSGAYQTTVRFTLTEVL